jgi:lipopolysaccharide export system protein LptA
VLREMTAPTRPPPADKWITGEGRCVTIAKFSFLTVVLFLGLLGVARGEDKNAAVPLGNTADISADKLQVDHEKRSAVFEGNVRASFGAFRVSCVRMSLKYTDSGEVAALKAEGSVKVTTKDATAESERAELDSIRGVLILTGAPVITQGPNRLQGARIEVTLASGRVEVMEAKGTFRLNAGASK